MSTNRRAAVVLFLLIGLVLSSCGGIDFNNLRVGKNTSITWEPAEPEAVSLDNCNGTSELSRFLSTETLIRKHIFVGTKAHLSKTKEDRAGFFANAKTWVVGKLSPTKVEVELSAEERKRLIAEIELAFEAEYEEAKGRIDSVDMSAAPGSHIIYTIEWMDQKQDSKVYLTVKDNIYSVDYSYTITIPNKITSAQEICPFQVLTASHLDNGQLMFTLESENMGSERFLLKTSDKDYSCSRWGPNTKRLYCIGPDLEPGTYEIELITQAGNQQVFNSSFKVP
jgi:hypothetical protein